MAKLISRRYANALFDLALEQDKIDVFFEEVKVIQDVLNNNSEFLVILNHPRVSGDEKFELFEKALKDKVSNDILGLIHLIIKKNRESELQEIFSNFEEKVLVHKKITTAYIYSAKELSETQVSSIVDNLTKNLDKQVETVVTIDENLIGGVKIMVDGHVIDYTIKTQLNSLKKQLLDIQLV